MKRFATDEEAFGAVPLKSSTKWPSKSSILETPERKRYHQSLSFADSGLGSSLFGSPPVEQLGVSIASPVLRTPTDRLNLSSHSLQSASTPSPLRSFVHVSPYSSSFCSPNLHGTPSRPKLRLSNPEKASGFRFTGESFTKQASPVAMGGSEFSARSRPLAVTQSYSAPSTSRVTNRCLAMLSPRYENDFENEDASADVTIPYAEPETPSKCFGADAAVNKMLFGIDDFPSLTTSTPLRDEHMCLDEFGVSSLESDTYRVPEQANGPLESSICEPLGLCPPSVPGFLFPTSPKPLASCSFSNLESPLKKCNAVESQYPPSTNAFASLSSDSGTAVSTPVYSENTFGTRPPSHFDAEGAAIFDRIPAAEQSSFKPFKPPSKPLKVMSRRWTQITCGETIHQVEMTREAREFLRASRQQTTYTIL